MPSAPKLSITLDAVIGLNLSDGFTYRADRPAKHCAICGDSFQPWIARSDEYPTDMEVQYATQILLDEWTVQHNKKHSAKEHIALRESGRMMTPEAAIKLIPLGIYPVSDMILHEDVRQAGREAPRAPIDDVPDK